MTAVRHLFLLTLLALAACSAKEAIDAVTPKADRAFAEEMVTRLRTGDRAWLRSQFDPELWARSGERLGAARGLYPRQIGTTHLIAYVTSTHIADGRTEHSKTFTLVTQGGGRWTTTEFQTLSTGGPARAVRWSVTPHSAPPPDLMVYEFWDRALPWVWGTLLAFALGGGGLIVWLVRRSRRRHDPWAGRDGGRT